MSRDPAAQSAALDAFLASVQQRALRMAELATGNRDDALDAVQDSMLALARNYRDRSADQWPPLFFRILQHALLQQRRRQRRQRRWLGWLDSDAEVLDAIPDPAPDPAHRADQDQTMSRLDHALRTLPLRQQQVVLLRVWQGLDTADTARAMGCGQGSVKTHLSRALHALRRELAGER
ncbi:MAG: RNA polymerase sigma factor [Panacagrimonas sp.]